MNIDKIYDKFILNDWFIYQIDVFKPFIDLYYMSKNKTQFKLFHGYIFRISYLSYLFSEKNTDQYTQKLENKYFLKSGLPDFRFKSVQRKFETFKTYFIGYNEYELPIFVHLNLNNFKNELYYYYSGFSQILPETKLNENRDYFEDYKEFSKFQNIPIKKSNDDTENPIITLSNNVITTINRIKEN